MDLSELAFASAATQYIQAVGRAATDGTLPGASRP